MRLFNRILTAILLSLTLLALVIWLSRVLLIVSDEIDSFNEEQWHENPWAVAQAHFELERMRTQLVGAYYSPTPSHKSDSILSIEIFWSRIDIIENGPNKGVLEKNIQLKELVEEIKQYLNDHESDIYNLTPEVHKQLIELSQTWSSQWQANTKSTFYNSSQFLTDISEHSVNTYEKIRILLGFISIFSIALLLGLIYLLIINKRNLTKAEDVSKMKTDFLSNMSHELRTPLNGIIGSINLIKKQSNEHSELIEILDKSSEALLAQIDDILDYSQIESGEMSFEKISFCLRDLIVDCTSIFKLKSTSQNLYLDISTAQDLDIYMFGDKNKIRQVILNLLGNAIKFTQKGGITIDVAYIENKENFEIELKIIDTGIGISKENQTQLFNSFCQADTSIKRRFGGTGLGLSISKKLIEAMGGKLTLESELEVGTKFGFNITLEKSNYELHQKSQNEVMHYSKISQKKLNFSGKKVLVVEDNIVNQKIICKVLSSFNIEVLVVENGLLAIEHSMQNIDLIFMDIQMPEMDGISASRILRERGINIPIVALTANATTQYKQKCYEAGMNEFLSKPFSLNRVEEILVEFF